jgi:hypothetical protein
MNEMATRNQIVNQAKKWIGRNEADGSFKEIIDIYNNDKPLPRGYKVKYTDEWCATFASAVAIAADAKDIIPKECSCNEMIKLFKSLGSWMENDAYRPAPGDYIIYDWEDKGIGENTAMPNHIGIVEKVEGNTITVIEGNKGQAVARREIAVNGRYIRGYGVPKYDAEKVEVKTVNIELDVLRKGMKGEQVKTLQRLLNALGYKMKNGLKTYGVDGSYGAATENAVKNYQKANGLTVDGVCGRNTWTSILK